MLILIAASMRAPAAWNTASAPIVITYAFAGSSTGGARHGTGTLNPYGPTTHQVITSGRLQFTVKFADGSRMTATSSTVTSGNDG